MCKALSLLCNQNYHYVSQPQKLENLSYPKESNIWPVTAVDTIRHGVKQKT